MRILSWNINGIRTLPQYYPWNTLKSCEAILQELKADIICFQEMKTTRSALDRSVALPDSFDSFFSFPSTKGGYSGVAIYTKSARLVPQRAEEGLSGLLQPKPPLTMDERISSSYPSVIDMELMPDDKDMVPADLVELDNEGRALVLDFGLFVLINVYCPALRSEERLPFKMNFHFMLGERVRQLIQGGRQVILAGDINCIAAPLDHGEGSLPSNQKEFWDQPHRTWFKNLLDPIGPMIDVVRYFWPQREGMFTCWNTRISARESNYGSRVDYILVTRGLIPWLKGGDIQASIHGSDHCPVYIDLHDEIVDENGIILPLRVALGTSDLKREPPRLAAKYWDEFSGKQTLLSDFFRKRDASNPSSTLTPTPPVSVLPDSPITRQIVDSPSIEIHREPTPSANQSLPSPLPQTGQKRKTEKGEPPTTLKRRKKKVGQTKLSSFFERQSSSMSSVISGSSQESGHVLLSPKRSNVDGHVSSQTADIPDYLESDAQFARSLEQESWETLSLSGPSSQSSKSAWLHLLAPVKPPNCDVHAEPAKQLTVTKPGPNKGKTFFICSRPLGPGYDSGKSKRLREEVNSQYKCNYFKWASEVKKEALQQPASPCTTGNR